MKTNPEKNWELSQHRITGRLKTSLLKYSIFFISLLFAWPTPVLTAQTSVVELRILNRQGEPVSTVTDGDSLRVQVRRGRPTAQALELNVSFAEAERPFAEVSIPAHDTLGVSSLIGTLGWYWENRQLPGNRRRIVVWSKPAAPGRISVLGEAILTVRPRPVVLVHGFISNAGAWAAYLGPDGYLASKGLHGFAVGDGQVEGVLKTGNRLDPLEPTHTIAENAEILQNYIAGVKRLTGASQVDLIAHSMGGLICRYYIDRLMQKRDVAQLIMLGTPHGGSDCANLPAALGFYLPAALELRPEYLSNIFNKQVTRRRGVPFHFLAGTPIEDAYQCPCSDVPSDLVVSLGSATAIAAFDGVSSLPILHTNMASSEAVFREFVAPLLSKGRGPFHAEVEQEFLPESRRDDQFSKVFSGRVYPDSAVEVIVNVEQDVDMCSFGLYDPTRTLTVTVRGASGKVIPLDRQKHGLRIIDDSTSMVYMSYGFDRPKEGVWKVTVQSTAATPKTGAPFAIFARMRGGIKLTAFTDVLLPKIDQPVNVHARIMQDGEALPVRKAEAHIRNGNGQTEIVPLVTFGDELSGTWHPQKSGIYGVDILVEAVLSKGVIIQRSAFLSLEVQPENPPPHWILVIGGIVLIATVFYKRRRWRKQRSHSQRVPAD